MLTVHVYKKMTKSIDFIAFLKRYSKNTEFYLGDVWFIFYSILARQCRLSIYFRCDKTIHISDNLHVLLSDGSSLLATYLASCTNPYDSTGNQIDSILIAIFGRPLVLILCNHICLFFDLDISKQEAKGYLVYGMNTGTKNKIISLNLKNGFIYIALSPIIWLTITQELIKSTKDSSKHLYL
ncbi:hypothetical protein ACJX0J_029343, partial [Zea mays]